MVMQAQDVDSVRPQCKVSKHQIPLYMDVKLISLNFEGKLICDIFASRFNNTGLYNLHITN